MDQGRPTIYDVARRCGVAASTVSRTFSHPSRVNHATREKVRAAADEVGYLPRPLARAEAPRRTRTITLVVTDIANPYYAPLIKAAQSQALEKDYTLVLTDSDESPRVEVSNLRQLLATTSGAILATSRLSDDVIRQIAQHRALVVINREIDGIPSLVVDTARGMRKAVRHLAAIGHRRIAYLSGPRNSWINSARWRAVQEESGALGLDAAFVGPHVPNLSGGHEAADALMLQRATAAIAYNDLIAIGALQRLQTAGISVPADFSLIGCDDIFGADLTTPGLTTIAGPTERLGRSAVDVLHAQLTHRTRTDSTLFDAHLVTRGSTAAPRHDN
ncbi:LacI family transcriptional regulator [Saccharopolyspora erythraea NRRL 2338]|uniref:Transcriptional regulator, LacI family n=2 Tax=Saccharopolyspora erythraea TaxID=1836 RepID=A4FJU1_SACEN|nr:LacI family DNA-binding transcriptional regulator [Saccharopolyspora erythraea]EQD82850.1 LacI family transcription regulator [Saccharopolyspora erythraea D]PFG97957.1 LacI family transcriptional regulator [Saccharopolyspora erythraea NRRL 2338]QRK88085.1 LacI family DNA-binding transcriptional regulator [Saccharopolyspora erythraea]CAM04316.1 transcriptional regulator, LacI family [Saccharopolyspora erythraea NRRL 2338]